jgi:hypothetical protein
MKYLLNSSFHASLLKNSIIQIIWWVIFFPGFFSSDSFAAVQMAKSGELGNSFTASWALYVRFFSFHGNAIALLTLINGLVLVYSVTRLGYAIFFVRTAAISTFLLTLTPVVSGMGITLWHDILMSAGILLVTSFFINVHKGTGSYKRLLILELLPGAVLSSFRPNGLPTIAVFAAIYALYIFLKHRSQSVLTVKFLATASLLSTIVTVIGSNLILGLSPINNHYAQEWMRNDISCYADSKDGKGFVEKTIPGIGSTNSWSSSAACTFLNTATTSRGEKVAAQKYIPSAWLTLLREEPFFVLRTHAERNAYLIPIPIFGIPTEPFLHSTIEIKDQGIAWAFPSIAERARFPMRAWNATRGLTGWAGLWGLLLIGLTIVGRKKNLVPLIAMSFAMMAIIFVVAPIPDGRYVLFVLIAGQLAVIGNFVEWFGVSSNRKDFRTMKP